MIAWRKLNEHCIESTCGHYRVSKGFSGKTTHYHAHARGKLPANAPAAWYESVGADRGSKWHSIATATDPDSAKAACDAHRVASGQAAQPAAGPGADNSQRAGAGAAAARD